MYYDKNYAPNNSTKSDIFCDTVKLMCHDSDDHLNLIAW